MNNNLSMSRDNENNRKKSLSKLPVAISGFPDYTPEQQVIFDSWLNILAQTCKYNGFTPLDLPLFVRKDLLQLKAGPDTEIYYISRLVSKDEKSTLTSFGLAFDRTVPFALWVRDNKVSIPFPYKRYDISLSFRGENPSPGRFRGFYQCDVDIVGPSLNENNDIQCLLTLIDGLKKLIKDLPFTVYVNNMTIAQELLLTYGFIAENIKEALSIIDKLDKQSPEEICNSLIQLQPDSTRIPELVNILSFKGDIKDFPVKDIGSNALKSLEITINNLVYLGINCVKFSPAIVRGLNYYTGIVFETFLDTIPGVGSIMSGGRYDNLVDIFSIRKETNIMGVGGSIGVSRLFDILTKNGLLNGTRKSTTDVIILYRKDSTDLWETAQIVRKEFSCDIYTGNVRNVSKQLDYANKMGIPIAVMIMDPSIYCIKNLYTTEQIEVTSSEDIIRVIKRLLL